MSELIHAQASKSALNFFRLWVLGIWLYIITLDPLGNLVDMPPSALTLKGFPLRMMPETIKPFLLSAPFLYGLKISIILSLLGRILNILPKTTGIACMVLLTLHQQFVRGFGIINHGELVLLYSLYVLVIADIAGSITRKTELEINGTSINLYSVPIIMAMLILCFTYSFTGIRRIILGGVDIYLSDTIINWTVRNAYEWGNTKTWTLAQFAMDQELLKNSIRIGFPIVTFFEAFAPLCLVSKRFRYAFILVMIPFHVLTWLFMNIAFWENLMLYILFIYFTKWFKKA